MRDLKHFTPFVISMVMSVVSVTTYAQAQTFTLISNPFPAFGDAFGAHVAAVGTDKVLIGAPGDDTRSPNSGAAYLFDLQGKHLQTFHSPNPLEDEFFGRWLIGVGSDRVLISAVQDPDKDKGIPTLPGMSYLFDLTGKLLQTFENPNPTIGDAFGISALLDTDGFAIGSPGDDTDGLNAGKVFLFEIGFKGPVQEFSDPTPGPGEFFGFPVVALEPDSLIVGAPDANGAGELYIFDIDSGNLISTIQHPDQTFSLIDSVDTFGTDKVLVGSESFEVNGQAGAGGVFLFDVLTGALEMTIPNPEPEFDDAFGIRVVALGTSAIVISADLDNPGGINNAGTLYLYNDVGVLRETLNNPTPSEGDQFGLALAAIDGDTVVVGAPQGEIDKPPGIGPGEAYIIFGLAEEIEFDPPEEFTAVGEPINQAVADFTGDVSNDVIVTVPGDDPKLNGAVQVFLNQGVDDFDDWLGLTSNKSIPVGREPSGVAVGLFNNDAFVDFAVSNAGDNNVMVFINQGKGNGLFNPPVTIDVGQRPSDVIAGEFTGDSFIDLAVANADDNNVWILVNDGSGRFAKGGMLPTNGLHPIVMDPEDLDDDKDDDIVGINSFAEAGFKGNTPGSVFVLINIGDGKFLPAVTHEIGMGPLDLSVGDLNRDGFAEIVAVNNIDATASILVNNGDGTFMPGKLLLVGDSPTSVEAVDLDADGDLDLAVVAIDIKIGPSVQAFQNIGINPGDLVFDVPVAFGVDADPNFVVSTDFNGDLVSDLITVNADDGKTGGSVTALINVQCPWDLDESGTVGTSDLLTLFAQWGTNPGGPPDFNGDGTIDTEDILILFANWGLCP